MKNLISILFFILIIVPSTVFAFKEKYKADESGFVSYDQLDEDYWIKAEKMKYSKGSNIDNPNNKIVLIWNHGGNESKEKVCNWAGDMILLGMLSGTRIGDKEIVLWMNCEITNTRSYNSTGGMEAYKATKQRPKKCIGPECPYWKHYLSNLTTDVRLKINEDIIRKFNANGVPFGQIFYTGHSCGAWNAIRAAAFMPDLIGGAIAFAPNCWPKEKNNPVRAYLVDELKVATKAHALVFASPDDKTHDWKATSTDLAWIADILGIHWVEIPKKEKNKPITINGQECRWDNGDKIVNGHSIYYAHCTRQYQGLILDFIKSRLVEQDIVSEDDKIIR